MATRISRPRLSQPSPTPSPSPAMPSSGSSNPIERSPSPAADVSGQASQVTNTELTTVVSMIERLEKMLAAMETPSTPASSRIAAPAPQSVVFPIAQPQIVTPAAAAFGNASGGAFSGPMWTEQIVNLVGELIVDGAAPPSPGPPGGPPCPSFLQWDPIRNKYRKRRGEVPPRVLVEVQVLQEDRLIQTVVMEVRAIQHRRHRK